MCTVNHCSYTLGDGHLSGDDTEGLCTFLGLIVIFDYVLCVVLVFPAICLFDKWIQEGEGRRFCVQFGLPRTRQMQRQTTNTGDNPDAVSRHEITVDDMTAEQSPSSSKADDDSSDWKGSFIMRILSKYYECLHPVRFVLVATMAVGFVVSIYFALKLQLPDTSAVRQLSPDHETELNLVGVRIW